MSVLLLLVLAFEAHASQEPSQGRPELRNETFVWLQQLVRILYPELGSRQQLTISSQAPLDVPWRAGGWFQIRVGTEDWMTTPPPNAPPAETSLKLSLSMDKFGRVGMLFGGPVRFEQQRKQFARVVEQREDWTEAQAVQALADAGAQYGPGARDRLLKKLPLKQLEPYIGRCEIEDLRFALREEQDKTSGLPKYRAELGWDLTLRGCTRVGEAPHTYVLRFEPFGGTLVVLTTRD